jgi:hypothetical protein
VTPSLEYSGKSRFHGQNIEIQFFYFYSPSLGALTAKSWV